MSRELTELNRLAQEQRCLEALVQPASGSALVDALDQMNPALSAAYGATEALGRDLQHATSHLGQWRFIKSLPAADSFEVETASISKRQVEHLVGLESPLAYDGIARTVHEIMERASRVRFAVEDCKLSADSALSAVDATLEATGISAWFDELEQAVEQQMAVAELHSLRDMFTEELQAEFTKELLQQPSWNLLLHQLIAAPLREAPVTDPPAPLTDNSSVTREQLEQCLEEVVERVVERNTKKLSRATTLGMTVTLLGTIIGIATSVIDDQPPTKGYDTERRPAHNQVRTSPKQRALKSGATLMLRNQPLTPIFGTRIEGHAHLVEQGRIRSWVKVEVQDCEGNLHSGWISVAAHDALDHPQRAMCVCAPSELAGPT